MRRGWGLLAFALLPLTALLPQPATLFCLIGIGAAFRLRCLARSLRGQSCPAPRGINGCPTGFHV